MNHKPDAEVVLKLISTDQGGKEKTVLSGYRPNYEVMENYLTSVIHELIGQGEITPGSEGLAHVWFISPEAYPHTLWPGREITVSEGSRVIGTAKIISVFNPVLMAENS